MEDLSPTPPAPSPRANRNRTGRDAKLARRMAEERLATAQRVSAAVESFHQAADRIDAAQVELAAAGGDRLAAVRELRACGLSVNEIASLTGLSSSRIQSLITGK